MDLLVRPYVTVGDYTTRLVVEQPNSHTYKSDAEIHLHAHNDGRLYIGGNRQRKIIFKTNAIDDAAAEAWTIGTPDDSTNFQISALNSTVQAILINKTSGDITAVGNISSSAASTGSFGVIRSMSTLGFSLINNQVYVNKDGSASTPSINVMPQGGNGFYKYASNEIGVATNGTATARFSSTAGLEMLVGNVSGSASSTGSFGTNIE